MSGEPSNVIDFSTAAARLRGPQEPSPPPQMPLSEAWFDINIGLINIHMDPNFGNLPEYFSQDKGIWNQLFNALERVINEDDLGKDESRWLKVAAGIATCLAYPPRDDKFGLDFSLEAYDLLNLYRSKAADDEIGADLANSFDGYIALYQKEKTQDHLRGIPGVPSDFDLTPP